VNKGEIVQRFFDNGTVKSVALSLACTAFGYVGNQQLQASKMESKLDNHAQQLVELKVASDRQTSAQQALEVGVAQIQGTLAVLSSKIDDDRRQDWEQRHSAQLQSRAAIRP
jgi:hypothetical protein